MTNPYDNARMQARGGAAQIRTLVLVDLRLALRYRFLE
jgi:hypothetical protein